MPANPTIFVTINPNFQVSVACVERVRWCIDDTGSAEVFLTEDSTPYRVENRYVPALENAIEETNRLKTGAYSDVLRVKRLAPDDVDLLEDFISEGWTLLEIEKLNVRSSSEFGERCWFVIGGDRFSGIPESYKDRHEDASDAMPDENPEMPKLSEEK